MSFALLAGVHALAFYRFSGLKGFPQGMFVPATIFFAEAIAYERLLAFTKELKVSRSFIDAAIGYQESATGYADISFVAQAVVISAATAVIALAIYQSSFLGVKWTTAGWSFVGIVLVILGFTWKSSIYRRTALVLFALCLVRVFLVDTRNLSDLYKTIAFIILGICLLGMAWLYTRFSADIRKWL